MALLGTTPGRRYCFFSPSAPNVAASNSGERWMARIGPSMDCHIIRQKQVGIQVNAAVPPLIARGARCRCYRKTGLGQPGASGTVELGWRGCSGRTVRRQTPRPPSGEMVNIHGLGRHARRSAASIARGALNRRSMMLKKALPLGQCARKGASNVHCARELFVDSHRSAIHQVEARASFHHHGRERRRRLQRKFSDFARAASAAEKSALTKTSWKTTY